MANTSILSYNLQKRNASFHIDYNDEGSLCFKETLMLCLKNKSATGVNSIGNCCISVERIGPQKCEFLINIKFCMDINHHFGGSKIICSATDEFECLEEKRTEYMYHEGNLDKKTLYIGIQDGNYYVKATQMCPRNKCMKCKSSVYQHNIKLLSEGTNLLLMRYLAIINYNGELTYSNILIDGDIATCHYKCTAAVDMQLHENQMKVYIIEHEVQNRNGNIESMKTYLTPEGRILEHNWMLTSYILKSESFENIKPTTEKFKTTIRNYNWAADMEMFSKFLDEKCHEVSKFIEYLNNHPEVKNLIADYAQTLLIVKPLHTVDFTIQHFKAFSVCPEIREFVLTEHISKIDMSMEQNEHEHADICNIYHHLCTNFGMFDQVNQLFQGSINSYCSTNSLCFNDTSYIQQPKTESTTTVFHLDIDSDYKSAKDEQKCKYNFHHFEHF